MNIEYLYKNTVKLFTLTSIVWALIAIAVGFIFVKQVEAIVIPLMGILMFFVSGLGVRFISLFQKINPFLSNKEIVNYFNMFVWYFGVISGVLFFFIGLYFCVANIQYGIYILMVWFFPLGASVGAFKSRQANG